MKIEKLSDTQIRCTLTKEDLANRHLKISELAYGTENAKNLFRDMMQQASYEFGFEAEDIPLMIEAIPISSDTIILLITKVEFPEELDTRFSKFSDPGYDDDFVSYQSGSNEPCESASANDILDLFQRIQQEAETEAAENEKKKKKRNPGDFIPLDQAVKRETKETVPNVSPVEVPVDLTKLFLVRDLDVLAKISNVLSGYYNGENTLFRDSQTHTFYLTVHKSSHSPEEFNKVCNILSEYATPLNFSKAIEAYFNEHFDCMIRNQALQQYAAI